MDNGWDNSAQAWIASMGERSEAAHQERARRVPWFVVMEWQKPNIA